MSNYTKPYKKDYEDKPEDWLLSSLIFTRALSFILPLNKGIIIDLVGDMAKLCPDVKRVIVFNDGKQISIIKANERTEFKAGDWIDIIISDIIKN